MYFLDAHVHLDSQSNFSELLEYGVMNMRASSQKKSGSGLITGMFFLAELPGQSFSCDGISWVEGQLPKIAGEWGIKTTRERNSFVLTNADGDTVYIVLGKQVNSTERLEVLLFGDDMQYADLPLNDILAQHSGKATHLVILPWGVGKWLGRRGAVITETLQQNRSFYCLGDNGNRPGVWSSVSQFDLAAQHGVPVLRGTDNLSLPREMERVGKFGMKIDADVNPEYPLQGVIKALQHRAHEIVPYGNLISLSKFVRSQVMLRLAKGNKGIGS